MMRSYSSAVRPCARARSSVTLGSAEVTPAPTLFSLDLALEEGTVLDKAAEERVEDLDSVRAAHGGLGRALRMRHHSQHRALFVDDAGDIVHGPVRIGLPRRRHVAAAIAEND